MCTYIYIYIHTYVFICLGHPRLLGEAARARAPLLPRPTRVVRIRTIKKSRMQGQ